MSRTHLEIRIPKRLAFVLVTLALLFSALECGQRLSDWRVAARRAEKTPSPYKMMGETALGVPIGESRATLVMRHHPLFLWKTRPNQLVLGPLDSGEPARVRTNALGYRGREWTREKPAGTLRVAVLGGSAAFGYGSTADETAIPGVLERLLSRPDRPVEVLNAGQIGHRTTQEVVVLAVDVLSYAPDVVVAYDGWNDWQCAVVTPPEIDLDWGLPSMREIDGLLSARPGVLDALLESSAVVRGVRRRVSRAGRGEDPRGADFTPRYERRDAAPLYARDLERICRLAKAYGAEVVLAPQAEPWSRAEPRPASETAVLERFAPSQATLVRALWPGMVAAAKDVAEREGAGFVDASRAFDAHPEDAVFTDQIHLNDRGNDLVARHLAPVVEAALARRMRRP